MRYCTKCLMPDSRPRIVFNAEGICNACVYAEEKHKNINWDVRRQKFLALVEPYRSKNGSWDCIVPWSGGKDSSSIAYKLKFEFGMNPLLVTFSPQLPNEVGEQNREVMVQKGFDHLFFRSNQRIHQHLSRRFFIERGNQKVAWDAGVNCLPIQVAVRFNIPLVFYAEHAESEYGGKVLSEEHKKMRDFTEVLENQIGDNPINWIDAVVSKNDLQPYIYPALDDVRRVGVKALYFGYFFKWSMLDNYLYIREKINFRTHPKGRTPGTFTHFDSLDDKSDNLYYYMQYIKFGFGRCLRDACRMIQNNQMTRQEALELVKRYDGEYCEEYLQDMLGYLNLTMDEFTAIVDKHRNSEIWVKHGSEWKLRFPSQ